MSLAGGPGHGRQPITSDQVPTDEEVEAAIAVLRYSADEDTIREKMKTTFVYRQAMVNNADKSADVFLVFPRFLDSRTGMTFLFTISPKYQIMP